MVRCCDVDSVALSTVASSPSIANTVSSSEDVAGVGVLGWT